MLVKLTLENFLAHGHTVIDIGPGLTVLVGPNNSGKSAVVEGLRCLATNPAPRHFIRHGAKQARVEAEFADGTRVTWIRKDKSAGYEILRPGATEPEEYWKLQGKVPEQVREVLRLNLVQLESVGRGLDVHLGNQKEPIFLLNEPPSAMAAFFASSTESAHLLAMQKSLRHKVRAKQGDERRVRARLSELTRDLRVLTPLPDMELRLAEARAEHDTLREARARLPALADTAEGLRRTSLTIETLRQRATIQARVAEPPRLWPAARLAEALLRRARLSAEETRAARRKAALDPLAEPPPLFPAARLATHLANHATRVAARNGISQRVQALEPLREPPGLLDTARLATMLAQRRGLEARLVALEVRAARAANLRPAPEPQATHGLAEAARALREAAGQAQALRERLAAQDKAMAACEARIAARLAEIGSCPLCGGRMDAEAFLRRHACGEAGRETASETLGGAHEN